MKHICIVGAGTAGCVIALELLRHTRCRVTLIDIDLIADKFDRKMFLETKISKDSFIDKFQTVGYGFGGTSNLWHGVLTRLDDEDFDYLGKAGVSLRQELKDCEPSLERYFGNLSNLDVYCSNDEHPLCKYFDIEKFNPKLYTVKFSPTRFRKKIITEFLKKTNKISTLLENTVAVRFRNSGQEITGLECSSNGRNFVVEADHYVVCAGALESPRLLMQSFSDTPLNHPLLGEGLMDHPSIVLGELQLPKHILYGQHGRSSFFLPNTQRIGFRIPKKLRRTISLNHSLFFRPHLEGNLSEIRQNMRALIYGGAEANITNLILNRSMFSAAVTLALEKAGIGYLSRRFLVSAQFEQTINSGNKVLLSGETDVYGRRIPIIQNRIDEHIQFEANHLSSLVSACTRSDAIYHPINITSEDFEPGSHHSGTCRLGSYQKQSVVDMNLCYHGLRNLYVCDASVIPKIGNANLTLTISSLATRLARHLSKVT